jgi:hypothetical protein
MVLGVLGEWCSIVIVSQQMEADGCSCGDTAGNGRSDLCRRYAAVLFETSAAVHPCTGRTAAAATGLLLRKVFETTIPNETHLHLLLHFTMSCRLHADAGLRRLHALPRGIPRHDDGTWLQRLPLSRLSVQL